MGCLLLISPEILYDNLILQQPNVNDVFKGLDFAAVKFLSFFVFLSK